MMALTGHGIGIRMNPASLHALAYFPSMTAAITSLTAFAMPFGGTVALTIMSTVFNNKSGGTTDSAKDGIRWAYITLIPFMWGCFLVTTLLGNVWILKNGEHEVVNGAYLWSFITRKKLERETKTRGDLAAAVKAPVPDEEKAGGGEGGSGQEAVKSSAGQTNTAVPIA